MTEQQKTTGQKAATHPICCTEQLLLGKHCSSNTKHHGKPHFQQLLATHLPDSVAAISWGLERAGAVVLPAPQVAAVVLLGAGVCVLAGWRAVPGIALGVGVLLLYVKLLLPSAAVLTMCEASLLADLTATAVPPLEESLEVFTSALPWASDTDTDVPPVDLASALASASRVRACVSRESSLRDDTPCEEQAAAPSWWAR
jgi:hypothetical protein